MKNKEDECTYLYNEFLLFDERFLVNVYKNKELSKFNGAYSVGIFCNYKFMKKVYYVYLNNVMGDAVYIVPCFNMFDAISLAKKLFVSIEKLFFKVRVYEWLDDVYLKKTRGRWRSFHR